MNILHLTFEAPSAFSGGGLAVKQSAYSLQRIGDVTYCGPNIPENCKKIRDGYSDLITLEKGDIKSLFYSIICRIPGNYYMSWIRHRREIDFSKFDFVFLEFSRYGTIAKWFKRRNITCFVRFHNIEYDYYKSAFHANGSIRSWYLSWIIRRQERLSLKYSKKNIFITDQDMDKASSMYNKEFRENRSAVIPICIEDVGMINRGDGTYALITGSLGQEQNVNGIIWFIENVWDKIKDLNSFKLTIAGRKPLKRLKDVISQRKNIELIDSPEEMTPLFMNAKFYVAPIFDGAGMKVKVAEALSYGVPVIGTPHAFIGYFTNEGCFIAHNEDEFISSVNSWISETHSDNMYRITKARELFEKYYSLNSSKEIYQRILFDEEVNAH